MGARLFALVIRPRSRPSPIVPHHSSSHVWTTFYIELHGLSPHAARESTFLSGTVPSPRERPHSSERLDEGARSASPSSPAMPGPFSRSGWSPTCTSMRRAMRSRHPNVACLRTPSARPVGTTRWCNALDDAKFQAGWCTRFFALVRVDQLAAVG